MGLKQSDASDRSDRSDCLIINFFRLGFEMKQLAANISASLVYLSVGLFLIISLRFRPELELTLAALFLVTLLCCWYFWQLPESSMESVRFWLIFTGIGFVWTILGFWIGSLIYRVSFRSLIFFDPEAWGGMGYLGPLAIGPFLIVGGLGSVIRYTIIAILTRKSTG